MNVQAVTVEGTLQPDGTLQLDQKPSLSPGRVQVIVQPLAPKRTARGLSEVMNEVEAGQRGRGYLGRTIQEMQEEETTSREENDQYEHRSEELWGGSLPPT